MKQSLFMDKYPILELSLDKNKAKFSSITEIMAYFKQQIEDHPIAVYIGEFDHFAHTQRIGGEIAPDMLAAQHLICCFGTKLPNPQVMAVRPRSIGVVEYADKFEISFLEPPMPTAIEAMTKWVAGLSA